LTGGITALYLVAMLERSPDGPSRNIRLVFVPFFGSHLFSGLFYPFFKRFFFRVPVPGFVIENPVLGSAKK
jgi:hypothetical protein